MLVFSLQTDGRDQPAVPSIRWASKLASTSIILLSTHLAPSLRPKEKVFSNLEKNLQGHTSKKCSLYQRYGPSLYKRISSHPLNLPSTNHNYQPMSSRLWRRLSTDKGITGNIAGKKRYSECKELISSRLAPIATRKTPSTRGYHRSTAPATRPSKPNPQSHASRGHRPTCRMEMIQCPERTGPLTVKRTGKLPSVLSNVEASNRATP